MDREEKSKSETQPRETANLLSLLTFFYTFKLFRKGFKHSLEVDDLYEVVDCCESKKLGNQLEKEWLIDRDRNRSMCWSLWTCFGKIYMVAGLVQLVMRTIVTLWFPTAVSKLISYFSPNQTDLTKNDAIYYAVVVIGISMFNVVYTYNYQFFIIELGIRVRNAICSLIYRKSLKLSTESLSQATMGKITTIITKDIDSFELFIDFGNDVWIGLIQTGIVCCLIYNKIGIAAIAGVSFFLVIIPLQVFIGRITYFLRLEGSKKTDERLELTQETLSAIKVIKMYTWEKYFVEKINRARKTELGKLQKLFYTNVVSIVVGGLCSKIAFFLFIMTHVWLGNSVTAELVYYIMSCFNNLEHTLGILVPYGISYFAQVLAAIKRVESILQAEELQLPKPTDKPTTIPKIILEEVSTKSFEHVSITVNRGLNILLGQVGSGKTTFLKTILHECKYTGNLIVEGSISYASQEPWLFPSSIKNNIIFGETYCEERYQKVLQICALNYDLETIRHRDDAIVGDRGVNLSKGQQARINLARAIYRKSDIYLLDDSLAALDANVSYNIFKNCMLDFLKDKICIFTTNNYKYVKQADRVIAISQGTIKYQQKSVEPPLDVSFLGKDEKQFEVRGRIEKAPKKRVYEEIKKSGKVPIATYRTYIGFGGGVIALSVIVTFFIATQAATSYSDKLMSNWVTLEQNLSSFEDKNTTEYKESFQDRTNVLNLYTIVVLSFTMLTLLKSFLLFTFFRRASINMHKTLVRNMAHAVMQFFDSHFIGNIINRLSKDLITIDENLPFIISDCLELVFVVPSSIILLTTVNVLFLIGAIIVFLIACVIAIFYQPTGRNLKRLDSLTRSPMIGHINATLEGLTTIRASRAQGIVRAEYDRHQNLFTSANYQFNCCMSALGITMEFFCTSFVAAVIIRFLTAELDTSVGDVGLAITQGFVLTDMILIGLKRLSICENLMTSVERILEYIEIEGEENNGKTIENWPKESAIKFEDVSLTYNNQTSKVLNKINFRVESGEKMGIVGRTGAGKSTIISTIFRLYEAEGRILIDGIDIKALSLDFLRSRIAVIPQDPIVFYGTIRDNFDPLRQHTDEEIWKVIQELGLNALIKTLEFGIDKSSSLSAGQKQLICLARAILRKSKIVVLDEATANVDQETDLLIREAIGRNFAKCTVIIVAHRLSSVLNCHQVAVLDRGEIVELGHPTKLLKNKNSFLYSVVK